MSVYSMKPNFNDRESYLAWRKSWKQVYLVLSERIRQKKNTLRIMQRSGNDCAKAQRDMILMKADATKMMTLLNEAKLRRDRILAMHEQVAAQPFPLEIEAKRIDFHWNKVCLEFPFMPPWVIKAKGQQYFVREINSEVGFQVSNTPDKSTKGSVRVRKSMLSIDAEGNCLITPTK